MTKLSIGITAHSEGILLHKTLLSVEAAVHKLEDAKIDFEILLHLDNPSADTASYSKRIKELLPSLDISILRSNFGNPSQSRNNIVSKATGTYITFIDGDDLISESWLVKAVSLLDSKEKGSAEPTHVAHPEVVMEFGVESTLIKRYGEINKTSDSLLSVFANRWNVVLMIRRDFLVSNPYPSGDGFGFEDWYINCLTIHSGLHNILVPETALFVRRKKENSMWLMHQSDFAVLPANPLLEFSNIRKIDLPEEFLLTNSGAGSSLKKIAKKYRVLRVPTKVAKKIVLSVREISKPEIYIPQWLKEERESAYTYDKSASPYSTPALYDSLTQEHYAAAIAYKKIVDTLKHNSYDYIIFAPWIIKGGADLFTLNYANTIAKFDTNRRVLVITTTNSDSPWSTRLDRGVDFIEFGKITDGLSDPVISRVLEHVIENSRATHLHIINSESGYRFINQHKKYLTSTRKKVIATSFSQSTDDTGRVFGYSHTHIPESYSILSAITTDNNPVKDMWVSEYGFNNKSILTHNQPVKIPAQKANPHVSPETDKPLDILWAARLSPEKQPELVLSIAKELAGEPVHFHIYGQADEGFDVSFLSNLPPNITYHGPFDGFESLHPERFDLYLYTSLFDGMPNSVLEAASFGLPIVASGVGGIPTLIEDSVNGYIVSDIKKIEDYSDKIKQLVHDPVKLSEFGSRIRVKISEDFSEKSYHDQIRKMLEKVDYL